jgi:hypothetical protein
MRVDDHISLRLAYDFHYACDGFELVDCGVGPWRWQGPIEYVNGCVSPGQCSWFKDKCTVETSLSLWQGKFAAGHLGGEGGQRMGQLDSTTVEDQEKKSIHPSPSCQGARRTGAESSAVAEDHNPCQLSRASSLKIVDARGQEPVSSSTPSQRAHIRVANIQ